MKTTTGPIILALLLAGSAAPAFAEENEIACTDAPASSWITEDAAKAKAAALGFDVRDLKVETGCYEIYAIDKDGRRVQAVMNPANGEIVGRENGENE